MTTASDPSGVSTDRSANAPTDPVDTQADQDRRPGPKLSETLWSIWSWFVFGACVIVWVPLMVIVYLVTLPFDRGRYWTGYLYRRMPVVHQKLNPLWHFRISGELPDNPRNPYVVVANHESFVDILLISHLPWEMKWLSKKEMFNIPVAGWLMYLAGDVKLYRGDKGSASKAMVQCKEYLRRHVSVMIFPEGTRDPDGKLGRFKDGAFRLAIEAQVPILPLAVTGTKEAMRKHDWRFGRADAEVHVMAPVETAGMTEDDVAELRDRVREMIGAQVTEMQAAASA